MLCIVLKRIGRKKKPVYKIICRDKNSKRNIDYVGTFNPCKRICIRNNNEQDAEKIIKYVEECILYPHKIFKRLGDGAQMSNTVENIFCKAGLLFEWHIEQYFIKNKITEEVRNKKIDEFRKNRPKKDDFICKFIYDKNSNKEASIFTYLDKDEIDALIKDENTCSICLNAYTQEEKVVRLKCNHCFHETCIEAWLKSNKTCPVCRANVK